jgi:asparaginyl-tRNA synthetase
MMLLRRALAARRFSTKQPPRNVARLLDWKPADGAGARDVVVNGYVRAVRKSKASQFVDVGDGSTRKSLQAVVPRAQGEGCELHDRPLSRVFPAANSYRCISG